MLSDKDKKRLLAYLGFCLRSGVCLKGSDTCLRYIRSKKIDCILIDTFSSDNTKSMLKAACSFHNIPYYELDSSIFDELFSTNTRVIGLKNSSLSNSVTNLLNSSQGEN